MNKAYYDGRDRSRRKTKMEKIVESYIISKEKTYDCVEFINKHTNQPYTPSILSDNCTLHRCEGGVFYIEFIERLLHEKRYIETMVCCPCNVDEELFSKNKPNRVALLNVPILTAKGSFTYKEISIDEARDLYGNAPEKLSAIGHEATAEVLTTLFGEKVEMNRIAYEMQPGDVCIVMKLRARIPEGKVLTDPAELEEIGYDFGLLEFAK